MAFGRSSACISLSSLESSTSWPELSLRQHSVPTADRTCLTRIDDFRGACAVKGNVQVAGRTSSVSTTEMLSTHDVTLKTLTVHYFMFKFDLLWGIRTKMGKTEGIFLNLQCDCHRVASMFIKLINLYTNFSTLLPNVTALWINGVSLNSLAHTFLYRMHWPNK